MIKIAEIENGSLADKCGLLPGDKILQINNEEIRDRLDFEFFRGDLELQIKILRGDALKQIVIEREYGKNLGIIPEIMKIHICKNDCVFCFVYQNPKGMRKSMYIKDEDYRYSFLDGHFTTLSNMKTEDWTRVLEQNLSPIYISVQSTNPELRGRLLGNLKLEPILERLAWLKENGIQFHTQLVVVPDWNDGIELERSLNELIEFYPAIQSISVVPIGLTGHRDKLVKLRPLTKADAGRCLEIIHEKIELCEKKYRKNIIFASDEMYVMAGQQLPPPSFYGDYSQYENGVGTLTSFKEDFYNELESLPMNKSQVPVTILTAPIASGLLLELLTVLKEKRNLEFEMIICENLTFGQPVSVTGLLCGKDFKEGLRRSHHLGPVFIPPQQPE